MNPPLPPAPAPASAAAAPPLPGAQQERVLHLFRLSRRAGLIHPLQHLVQRWRAESAA